ncbi:MAG: hypothetical protein GY884_15165, partial [Proteobacteria bacterium]|nr:hypothetical protein [Pseudomonadota bacterium]
MELGPGVWRLEKQLTIEGDGVVLRGAGSGSTVLDCPQSLGDVYGWGPGWSWSGGFVKVQPPAARIEKLATVDAVVERGLVDMPLKLAAGATPPRAGEWLELSWFNDKGTDSLLLELHGNLMPRSAMGKELRDSDSARVRTWVQVVSWMPGGARERLEELDEGIGTDQDEDRPAVGELVPSGPHGSLTIEAPLRLDLRPEWRPTLKRAPTIHDVGIEGLAFRFPETKYPGHLKERGYNGIHIARAIDCWVSDVATMNADSG